VAGWTDCKTQKCDNRVRCKGSRGAVTRPAPVLTLLSAGRIELTRMEALGSPAVDERQLLSLSLSLSLEQLHYRAKKIEQHTFNATYEAQCSEEGTKGPYLDDQSARINQAYVSNASPISYTYPPQSNHKNPDSTFQCVRLNVSTTLLLSALIISMGTELPGESYQRRQQQHSDRRLQWLQRWPDAQSLATDRDLSRALLRQDAAPATLQGLFSPFWRPCQVAPCRARGRLLACASSWRAAGRAKAG
jgi:hypothetical protein